jgi:hypothetical protein
MPIGDLPELPPETIEEVQFQRAAAPLEPDAIEPSVVEDTGISPEQALAGLDVDAGPPLLSPAGVADTTRPPLPAFTTSATGLPPTLPLVVSAGARPSVPPRLPGVPSPTIEPVPVPVPEVVEPEPVEPTELAPVIPIPEAVIAEAEAEAEEEAEPEVLESELPLTPGTAQTVTEANVQAVNRINIQLGDTDARIDTLDTELTNTNADYAALSPKQQKGPEGKALVKRGVEIAMARGALMAQRSKLENQSQETAARAVAAQKLATRDIQAQALESQAQRNAEIRETQEARIAENRSRQEAEVARDKERRAAYREALRRGPDYEKNTGSLVAGMVAESLRANVYRREPNFQNLYAEYTQKGNDAFNRANAAMESEITEGADDIQRLAEERANIDAETARFQAAAAEEAESRLKIQLAKSTRPLDRIVIQAAVDKVKRDRADLDLKTKKKTLDALLLRDKHAADIALTKAKTAKTEAETNKVLAEAAKASKSGSGSKAAKKLAELFEFPPGLRRIARDNPEAARRIQPRVIPNPAIGDMLLRSDGTPALALTAEEGKNMRASGAALASTAGLIDDMINLRAKHKSETLPGDAKKLMTSLGNQLLLKLKGVYQLGVLSDSDAKLVKDIMGGELTDFLDITVALKAIRSNAVSEYNDQLRNQNISDVIVTLPPVSTGTPKKTVSELNVIVSSPFEPTTGSIVDPLSRVETLETQATRHIENTRAELSGVPREVATANAFMEFSSTQIPGAKGFERIKNQITDSIAEAKASGDKDRVTKLNTVLRQHENYGKLVVRKRKEVQSKLNKQKTRSESTSGLAKDVQVQTALERRGPRF